MPERDVSATAEPIELGGVCEVDVALVSEVRKVEGSTTAAAVMQIMARTWVVSGLSIHATAQS